MASMRLNNYYKYITAKTGARARSIRKLDGSNASNFALRFHELVPAKAQLFNEVFDVKLPKDVKRLCEIYNCRNNIDLAQKLSYELFAAVADEITEKGGIIYLKNERKGLKFFVRQQKCNIEVYKNNCKKYNAEFNMNKYLGCDYKFPRFYGSYRHIVFELVMPGDYYDRLITAISENTRVYMLQVLTPIHRRLREKFPLLKYDSLNHYIETTNIQLIREEIITRNDIILYKGGTSNKNRIWLRHIYPSTEQAVKAQSIAIKKRMKRTYFMKFGVKAPKNLTTKELCRRLLS